MRGQRGHRRRPAGLSVAAALAGVLLAAGALPGCSIGPSSDGGPAAAGPSLPPPSPPPPSPPPAKSTVPPATPATLPGSPLPGVNDPGCRSADRPVVLVHGTFSTVASNFAPMAAALQAAGRCVYGLDYGLGGLRPVRQSAAALAAFVDQVLAADGTAERVDVVAFSQGGLVLRTALRLDGLAPEVAVAVLIAPTFHGTTSELLDALPAAACPACADQEAGSGLLAELARTDDAAGGELVGDVHYAVVSSRDDTVVTPLAAQVPAGPADRIRAIVVQDSCPGAVVDHVALPADPGVIDWAVAALQTDGAPDPAALTCT